MLFLKYTRELDAHLRNVSSLPAGMGCRYLLCLNGPKGELIAKSWHRKMPRTGGNVVLIFA